MNSNHERFDTLRRALAVKRHEQPPPGYFNDFSSQVIGRIRAGDTGASGSFLSNLWEVPWLQRFWATLESKPILSGGFAVGVCAVLVAGVIYSESSDVAAMKLHDTDSGQSPPMMAVANGVDQGGASLALDHDSILPGSENLNVDQVVLPQQGNSIFSDIQRKPLIGQPQLLNVKSGGNN